MCLCILRTYTPSFGSFVCRLARDRRHVICQHCAGLYRAVTSVICTHIKVPLPGPPQPASVNLQLSDWELFQKMCLRDGAMTVDALGPDLWDDVAELHRYIYIYIYS